MAEIRQTVVTVNTTGSAGSATGQADSEAISGYLLDVHLNFHGSAPATTDTTISLQNPALGTVTVVSNSATDARVAPRQPVHDAAGAAISGGYDLIPVNGGVRVALAQSDQLTAAVVATIRYLVP